MKKLHSTLLIVMLLALSGNLKAQLPSDLETRLQRALDSVCTKYNMKGASAAVLYPGAGTWKGVHGISHSGNNITPDMLFGMGSNTKTFICALLLKMQENNLIDLDDSIGRWITGYPNISGSVTIRQCLNHTSGIADYLQNAAVNDSIDNNPGKIWQMEELLALAKTRLFVPGASWEYSNTNYVIAGIIIRDVLQKPVTAAMREMILQPAGLSDTYFYGESGSESRMPHQWSMNITGNSLTDLNTMTPNLLNNLFSMATTAGAMVSTAEDNVKFWHKLHTGQIVNPASLNEMRTFVDIGNAGYGLGMFFYSRIMNGRSLYTHGGTFFGFINENMVDTTSGVCISVMTNQDSLNNNMLFAAIMRALHRVTLQMPVGLREAAYNNPAFRVYPNPASDVLNIETSTTAGIQSIVVYDITGREVKRYDPGYEQTLPVGDLLPGIYTLHVNGPAGAVVHIQKLHISR